MIFRSYNAKLVGIGTSTTGFHATAKVSVDATGGLTDVTVMDGGSAYAVGNRLHVVGIATTTTLGVHTSAIVTVTEIYDNTGDVVRLTGVTSETYNQFNSLYRITEIGVGAAKSFRAASDVSISGVTTAGIGTSPLDNAAVYVTGESLRITNLSYETNSGIATLTSASNHGLRVNSKIRINTGITTFNGDPFEGSFIVTNKRIIFSGATSQRDFPLNKINTIDVMDNGITLSRAGKTKTEYYIGFDVLKIPMTITPDENEQFDSHEHTFVFDGYHVRQIIQKLIQKI